jgi:hypothetical protein
VRQINSRKEFRCFYPYKSPPNSEPCPKPGEYPKKYPCFAEIEHCDGGLGGDHMRIKIVYPPKSCDLSSFAAGLKAREVFYGKYR